MLASDEPARRSNVSPPSLSSRPRSARPGPRTRIENPIHNGPEATVLGDMALQSCWHPRIKDLVAHRRKEAAEVGEIKSVLRVFDLPVGRPAVKMDRNFTHSTSP